LYRGRVEAPVSVPGGWIEDPKTERRDREVAPRAGSGQRGELMGSLVERDGDALQMRLPELEAGRGEEERRETVAVDTEEGSSGESASQSRRDGLQHLVTRLHSPIGVDADQLLHVDDDGADRPPGVGVDRGVELF